MTDPEPPLADSRPGKRRFAVFTGIALSLTCIFVLAVLAKAFWPPPRQTELLSGSFLPAPKRIEAFNLISDTGKPFTPADLNGHWTLVFAGYSYCPEVCPATLALLKAALARLGDEAKTLKVLFLSIDPEHDTPERLAAFIRHFGPEFQAATGSAAEVAALAGNLGLAVFKEQNPTTNQFEFQHSAIVILVNPQGEMAGYLSPPFTVEALAADIKSTLATE